MSRPESAAEVLDRELGNTRRAGIVTAAAIAVASAGALDVIGALQLWTIIRLRDAYQYVPGGLLVFGVVLVFLASRIYGQHQCALLAAIALMSLSAIGTGAWAVRTSVGGFLSLLGILMPLASLAAAILAQAVRSRAAAARSRGELCESYTAPAFAGAGETAIVR